MLVGWVLALCGKAALVDCRGLVPVDLRAVGGLI